MSNRGRGIGRRITRLVTSSYDRRTPSRKQTPMEKPTDIRLLDLRTETERIAYRAPIKFGGRVVTDAVLLNVILDVETRDGRCGQGFGSMPMGNVVGWPAVSSRLPNRWKRCSPSPTSSARNPRLPELWPSARHHASPGRETCCDRCRRAT